MILRFEAHEDAIGPFLEQRRRMGGDRWDEVWEGVIHMVPSPTERHQHLAAEILIVTGPLAKALGLRAAHELSLYRPGEGERDYRNPDLMYYLPPTGPNVEHAELVVEILSPGDETYRKIPFYRSLGVKEILVVDPVTRVPELHLLDGSMTRGTVRSEVLRATFEAKPGPALRISWEGGEAQV